MHEGFKSNKFSNKSSDNKQFDSLSNQLESKKGIILLTFLVIVILLLITIFTFYNSFLQKHSPFIPEVWGNVADWAMLVVTVITAIFIYKTLNSQTKVQQIQLELLNIEQKRCKSEMVPDFDILNVRLFHQKVNDKYLYMINFSNNKRDATHFKWNINIKDNTNELSIRENNDDLRFFSGASGKSQIPFANKELISGNFNLTLILKYKDLIEINSYFIVFHTEFKNWELNSTYKDGPKGEHKIKD